MEYLPLFERKKKVVWNIVCVHQCCLLKSLPPISGSKESLPCYRVKKRALPLRQRDLTTYFTLHIGKEKARTPFKFFKIQNVPIQTVSALRSLMIKECNEAKPATTLHAQQSTLD
jgi:hypothetical protein